MENANKLFEIESAILHHSVNVIKNSWEIGKLLIEAKDIICKHGEFIKWCNDKFKIAPRHVERLMIIARTYIDSEQVIELGSTKALELAKIKDVETRNAIIAKEHNIQGEKKRVSEMTVKQVQNVVKEMMTPKSIYKTVEVKKSSNLLEQWMNGNLQKEDTLLACNNADDEKFYNGMWALLELLKREKIVEYKRNIEAIETLSDLLMFKSSTIEIQKVEVFDGEQKIFTNKSIV